MQVFLSYPITLFIPASVFICIPQMDYERQQETGDDPFKRRKGYLDVSEALKKKAVPTHTFDKEKNKAEASAVSSVKKTVSFCSCRYSKLLENNFILVIHAWENPGFRQGTRYLNLVVYLQ